jgi:parallel beta-helix repeat protein
MMCPTCIYFDQSSSNILRNNILTDIYGYINVWGDTAMQFIHDIDESNTMNGKPIHYWVNRQNMVVPSADVSDASCVTLVNCTNITIKDLCLKVSWLLAFTKSSTIFRNTETDDGWLQMDHCSNDVISQNDMGLSMYYSEQNAVYGNNLTSSWCALYLYYSEQNAIYGNNFTNSGSGGALQLVRSANNSIFENNIKNNLRGVVTVESYGNLLYHNNFENNAEQVYDKAYENPQRQLSANFWDDGYQSGGNYWSDYADVDLNKDGIWDNPYVIDTNNTDHYPLVNPWTEAQLKFRVGDQVRTIANLNVREGPGLGYALIDTVPEGTLGQIVEGPVETDGYVWWEVDYTVGVRGWSVGDWLEICVDQPPNCRISLQKDGAEIGQVDVNEFFDICVGDSTDDIGIKQVRFSNDDVRDGKPTGRWTEWYDWHTSFDDWDALAKIRRWAFYSPGYKEVWAEVIDEAGQTATCSADMYAPVPALPVLVSALIISPAKDMYSVGDSLTAEFTVENIGETPIRLDKLTVGGRINGVLQPDGYPDFTYRQTTLQSGIPYHYSGSLTLTQTGNYRFFIAYHIQDPTPDEKKLLDENNWNTCIELGEDLTQTARVKNIIVFEEGVTPEEVSHMGETISKLTHIQPYIPPYLLSVDSWKDSVATLWAGFTSWATQTDLTEKYDELYYAGINCYGLRTMALSDANHAFLRGDIELAKKNVERSRKYDKLACMSFVAASAVFDGNMEAGQVLAQGIREGCEVAVKLGVNILFPSAGIAADGLYLAMNFGFNTFIEGMDKAALDMAVDAVFLLIFKDVDFTSIDPNTLMPYVNQASKNRPFTELLANEEFMTQFGLELKVLIEERVKAQTGQVLGEYILSKIVGSVIEHIRSLAASEQGEAKCPVELRAKDSEGRVTGIIDGRVKQEIPLSFCCNGTVHIFLPSDSYSYELVGTDTGTYGLAITHAEDGNTTTFDASDIPISTNARHVYNINWTILSEGAEGVTVQTDSESDSEFEHAFTSDSELTQSEFLANTVLLGDLNLDSIINILDAISAASAFGSRAGDPGWNEQADINRDGVVNILDVITLANNFGQHYP